MNSNNGFSNLIIIGLVLAVVIVGVVVYFTLISKPAAPPQGNQGETEPQIALLPYVDVEATVASLFLDDLYSDCNAPEVCPKDRVTLKIDKIDRTGDPNSVVDLNIGDQIEFYLMYSARAAKLRADIPPICRQGEIFKGGSCISEGCEGSECPTSSPQYAEKPAELEGNYIVYHLPQRTDNITEKILPGLEEKSRLKIRIWQSTLMSREIGEYEIIP